MKLEVGMYVRTDRGIIGKIYEKIGDMFTYEDSNRDYITYGLTHNEILKASHNIIDLIEVGDYVNGVKVHNIFNENGTIGLLDNKNDGINFAYHEGVNEVLTKEQYEANCYKVVE